MPIFPPARYTHEATSRLSKIWEQGQVEGDLTDDDVKKLNASEALRALLLRQE